MISGRAWASARAVKKMIVPVDSQKNLVTYLQAKLTKKQMETDFNKV